MSDESVKSKDPEAVTESQIIGEFITLMNHIEETRPPGAPKQSRFHSVVKTHLESAFAYYYAFIVSHVDIGGV